MIGVGVGACRWCGCDRILWRGRHRVGTGRAGGVEPVLAGGVGGVFEACDETQCGVEVGVGECGCVGVDG